MITCPGRQNGGKLCHSSTSRITNNDRLVLLMATIRVYSESHTECVGKLCSGRRADAVERHPLLNAELTLFF